MSEPITFSYHLKLFHKVLPSFITVLTSPVEQKDLGKTNTESHLFKDAVGHTFTKGVSFAS